MELIIRMVSQLTGRVAITVVTLLLLAGVFPVPAEAGFTGYYDLSNWSVFNSSANGTFAAANAGNTLVLTGSDDQTGNMGLTYAWLIAPSNLLVSFSYTFVSMDGLEEDPAHPTWDIGGYVNSGLFFQLSLDALSADKKSIVVGSGQVFGFGVKTLDNWGGPGQLSVTNFDARAVPEPSAAGPMLFAVAAAVVARRWVRRFLARG